MYNFQNALSELFNLGKKYLTNLDKSQFDILSNVFHGTESINFFIPKI